MLIPSIDLMGGKIVQLVQGEKKALEFDDFEPWIERFARYPLVQIIDLDAAIGQGDNRQLVRSLLKRLRCQVGGGIRTADVVAVTDSVDMAPQSAEVQHASGGSPGWHEVTTSGNERHTW